MNPSTAEIFDANEANPADEVLDHPNNANVILTAEQDAELSSKTVRVIPSRSVQAGLAAMGRYVPTNSPDENQEDMLEALASVSTGEVTVASRDAELDGVKIAKGSYLGLVNDTAVVSGEDLAYVAREVVAHVLDGHHGWLGILTGEGAPSVEELLAEVGRSHPDVDVEVHEGGQAHYPLLVVAE
jgi:dihydroxyacetone kinase-like predicted kinase